MKMMLLKRHLYTRCQPKLVVREEKAGKYLAKSAGQYILFHFPLAGTCLLVNKNCIQRGNSRIFTISSLLRKPSPTRMLKWPGRNRVQITCNTSSAYHVQHVILRATWYEGAAQVLSLKEFKSHLFERYFIGWTIYWWRPFCPWGLLSREQCQPLMILCPHLLLYEEC